MPGYKPLGGSSLTPRVIETVTTGAGENVSFTSIPQTYSHLQVWGQAVEGAGGIAKVRIQFNGDTANNYDFETGYRYLTTNTTGTTDAAEGTDRIDFGRIGGAGGAIRIDIPGYASRPGYAVAFGEVWEGASSSIYGGSWKGSGQWRSSAAITRIDIIALSGGKFAAGSIFTLIGIP